MKKFLSLVLALVMTMSLVTVSAGAKDFTDNDKITYDEAVAVMSAAKVIDGYAEGDFRPTATLTRGAAAKIICNLILGPTAASALVADAAPYSDVAANHPFAGYIAYCQKEGIISGYADGTFKPGNTLTGYAFMKMLLGALGYDSAIEGYTGANWSIAVAKQAINAGLNKSLKGSFNGVKAVNREEACLYAFNTLNATMVEYTNQTIVIANGTVKTDKVAKDMENNARTETIKEDNQPAAEESTESADTEDSSAEATKTEYPLTITTYDYDGNEIETTYEKAPEKVLAVYQGSIETMLALGLEDRLVATAGLDNEVPDELKDAFSKTNYLDEFTPSLETVTMLEPDMILSWSSLFSDKNLGNVTDWIDKGCNTYYNTNTRPDGDRTLENEFTDILNLGKIFDVQDKAQAIVDDAKAVIDKTLTATADVEEKPSVMVLEPLGEDITNYGAKSLGGDMVTQLGATLANPDASTAGKEDIIAANPDVIFVVYMPYAGDDPETVKESQLAVIKDDEALQSLDAVKNGRVYPIMLSEMYASATRTQDGIETFAKGLYPDVNLD